MDKKKFVVEDVMDVFENSITVYEEDESLTVYEESDDLCIDSNQELPEEFIKMFLDEIQTKYRTNNSSDSKEITNSAKIAA